VCFFCVYANTERARISTSVSPRVSRPRSRRRRRRVHWRKCSDRTLASRQPWCGTIWDSRARHSHARAPRACVGLECIASRSRECQVRRGDRARVLRATSRVSRSRAAAPSSPTADKPTTASRLTSPPDAGVRNAYAAHEDGATGYYAESGASYANPHDGGVRQCVHDAIRSWPELFRGLVTGDPDDNDGERVLDLSCGAGEVTDALVKAGVPVERVDACDPYTSEAYYRRVGKTCHAWSFQDIARGDLVGRRWKTVICSFAMHLCEKDFLPPLVMMLACSCDALIVLTPHKRPELDKSWGFTLTEEKRDATWRIRTRRYDKT